MRSNVRMACDSGCGAIVRWAHIQFIIKLYGISAQTYSRVGANKLTATAAHTASIVRAVAYLLLSRLFIQLMAL